MLLQPSIVVRPLILASLTALSHPLWAKEIIQADDPNQWGADLTKESAAKVKIHLPVEYDKGFGCGEEEADFFILRIFTTGSGLGIIITPEKEYSSGECSEESCDECYFLTELLEENYRAGIGRDTVTDDQDMEIHAVTINPESERAELNCHQLREPVKGKLSKTIRCTAAFKLTASPISPLLFTLENGTTDPAIATFATFSGTLATSDEIRQKNDVIMLNPLSTAELTGTITDSLHDGQLVDTLLVVGYANMATPENKLFYMSNAGNYELWDGDIASLSPLQNNLPLTHGQLPLEVHSAPLSEGIYDIYFGYRLAEGTIIFNGVPIKFQVTQ